SPTSKPLYSNKQPTSCSSCNVFMIYRFLEYKAGHEKDIKQPTLQSFPQKVQVYSLHSPRHQAIAEAIVKDLIVGCSLLLSFVENGHFKHFIEIMDCKYTPVSRRTICEKWIPVLVKKVKETVLEKLATQSSVSLTTDLWSDRRLRSFLGVTAHVCCKKKGSYALESYLLDCMRFTGRHGWERIASAFEEITEEYGIRQKISYIITDNAANMKCSDDSESEEENLDDVGNHNLAVSIQHYQTLMTKTSRFTTLLHSSSQFKDKFEAMFDTSKTIPAANNTRWNSTFKQVQSLTALDHKALTEMCSKDYEDVTFSPCEWTQLKELCTVLAPFSVATDLAEGEKSVTISIVVPTVSDLNTHLLEMEETRMQCRPLVKALRQSLMKRFSGIFTKTNMKARDELKKLENTLKPSKSLTLTMHLSFGKKNRDRFPQLHKVALKVLTVPASSAPVERVFSRGGIIMRPHRARLGHKMLQSLMLLKCNQTLL
uniref:HAT C-terminal dimerisation domain-containing protein n=1 Tax=Amphiprion percula TaxID=161767 RepID=A0A3P8SXC3_AMPPE